MHVIILLSLLVLLLLFSGVEAFCVVLAVVLVVLGLRCHSDTRAVDPPFWDLPLVILLAFEQQIGVV